MQIKRRTLLSLLALLMLASIVLGGCNGDSSEKEAASEPVVQNTAADDVGGQEITLVEPETNGSTSTKHQEYVVQTRLTEMHLFNDTTGMAWGLTRSALRMYLTQNNGKNWTPLSPSEQVTFSNVPEYGREVFFTDPQHGWVVRSAGSAEETLVLRTIDGGENWALATLGRLDELPVSFYFADNRRGWLLTSKSAATVGREDKTLYRTIDGGESWRAVMRTASSTQPNGSIHPLPELGYASGIHFKSDGSGYATMSELGQPAVYQTMDGGKNWNKSSTFASPSEKQMSACDIYVNGKPQSYANDSGSWVPMGCKQRDTVHYDGYFTPDNGQTWKWVSFPLPAQTALNPTVSPVFMDRMNGWMARGSKIYRTQNGGVKWNLLPENKKLGENMEKYPEIFQLEFVSDKVGWILIGKTEIRRSLLMQTLDGGLTWTVL
ncbi:hypothetical protein B9G55_05160 [Saccharibacillus sp. O16]|nr:hypothetical protein B9G55_05160 [Saccharibacillus sp. O16]